MESTLGKRIIENRKRLGMTQDQLAEKLGITAQAVSKWENDLSCPDISILPKLADIFGITTDELLGRQPEIPVCETQIVQEEENEENGFSFNNGKVNLHWDGAKLEGLGLACWVLLTGIVYLVAQLTHMDVSLWDVAWPSFLLVLGLWGLYPKFSAFRLGCALFGGYFLMCKLNLFPIHLGNSILIAVAVVLFGLGLLADALRKDKNPKFTATYTDENDKVHHGKLKNSYNVEGNTFTYEAAFGESTQTVLLDKLKHGTVCVSFGEYELDLSGVNALEDSCKLEAECSFGELTILVPRYFTVLPDSSTAFASFEIKGQPDSTPQGTIYLDASVSFGEICIRYL